MKVKLAFGILPYLLIENPLPKNRLGQSKCFIVWVTPNPTDAVIKHEEVHIAFYYTITLAVFLPLLFFAPWWLALPIAAIAKPLLSDIIHTPWKSFEESFAYARGAAYSTDTAAYLRTLQNSRLHKERYGEDFHERVRKRMRWFQ